MELRVTLSHTLGSCSFIEVLCRNDAEIRYVLGLLFFFYSHPRPRVEVLLPGCIVIARSSVLCMRVPSVVGRRVPMERLPRDPRRCSCKHRNATCGHVRAGSLFLPKTEPERYCRDDHL